MRGKIKWLNSQKGYGFIIGDDEKDYFLHVSQIQNAEELAEGNEVEFDVKETPKGKQAVNVMLAK